MKNIIIIQLLILLSLSTFSQNNGKCISGNCKDGDGKVLLKSGDTLIARFRKERPFPYGEIHYKNQNIYTGYIYKNLPNGAGQMIYSDGTIYNGFWENGKRQLYGSIQYLDGTRIYAFFDNDILTGPSSMKTGCLAGNCVEGSGSYIYADGAKYNGNFWGTLKHGKGNYEFKSGIVYMGDWVLDTIQGYGTMRYPNGDYYEGQFVKGDRSGYGKFHNSLTKQKIIGLWENGEFIESIVLPNENEYLSGNRENGAAEIKYGAYSQWPGSFYKGNLKDGKKDGFGKLVTIDGNEIYGYWQKGSFLKTDTIDNRCNLGDCIDGYGLYDWASGEYYVGFWQQDRRCYYGTNYFASGNKYSGFWKKDKKDGYGVHTYNNGESYSGHFKSDWRNGMGEFLFSNGNKYIGEFRYDTIYGEGIMYYPDGKIERGFWRGDKLVRLKEAGFGCVSGDCWYGYGTYISKQGDRYIGQWLDTRYNGQGLLYETNGDIYVGEFIDGRKEGYGKQFWSNGERYIGYWKNNKIDGRGMYIYRNGSLLNAFWREGKFVVNTPKNPDVPKIIWEVPLASQTVVYSNKYDISFGVISATKLSNVQIYIDEKLTSNFVQYDTANIPLAEYDYTLIKKIKLKEGDNVIKIVAVNDYGQEKSVNRTIRYKQNAFMKKQALIIANTYENKEYDYYGNNADELEKYLKEQNFEVKKALNPTKIEFEKLIRDYGLRLLANQTTSFFYYGGLMKQVNSTNYFVLSYDSIATQEDVVRDGVEINRLYSELQYGGSKDNSVVLDYSIPKYHEALFRLNGEWGLFPSLPPLSTTVYFSAMPGTELGVKIAKNIFLTEFLTNLKSQNNVRESFKQTKTKIETATNMHQIPFYLESNSKL
ncbi:MAG: hypothetical protein KAI79_17230 [Bacteroidales bacterium]|nr:hypothetical protein [Bacteroidales bacterium]